MGQMPARGVRPLFCCPDTCPAGNIPSLPVGPISALEQPKIPNQSFLLAWFETVFSRVHATLYATLLVGPLVRLLVHLSVHPLDHPSVGPSVGQSVHPSIGWSFEGGCGYN